MMSSRVFSRSARAAGGAVAAGFTVSLAGEHTSTKVTSRAVNAAGNRALRGLSSSSSVSNAATAAVTPASTISTKSSSMSTMALPKNNTFSNATGSNRAGSNSSFSFLQWYEKHLDSRPVATKMCTGAVLWGIGDAVAQLVPPLLHDNGGNRSSSKGEKLGSGGHYDFDFARTGRAVFFGCVIHAPTAHLHYNFLETLTTRVGLSTGGLQIPIFKAFMEQFVYWSWISNSMYHGAMGIMQGSTTTPQQVYDRISDVLWETQKAQWAFWIPVQLLNFKFVPVRHQLNVVLLTSIVWTALLSAWYPPSEEKDEKKKILAAKESEL